MRYDAVVIHYAEITLKRGKRGYFERLLRRNLEQIIRRRVRRLQGRFVIDLDGSDPNPLLEKIGKVFGVSWYAPAVHVKGNLEELEERTLEGIKEIKPRSFKIDARRSDKTFPLTSLELARKLGKRVSEELGIKVDLKSPELAVVVEVTEDGFYASFQKIPGLGGLPVGASGRVLALLSGGIDSPVASWLMMKRGCKVDLLHFHPMASHKEALESKIGELTRLLSTYGLGLTLFLASFRPFHIRGVELPARMEMVAFRAYMLRVADRLSREKNYLGIVTGDSLGQVASQTLENLRAVSQFSSFPIYRPLIGMDKQEVVELAKRIGSYELSIKEYADCCSIVARHPETRADPERLKSLWEEFGLEEAVDETLRDLGEYRFNPS